MSLQPGRAVRVCIAIILAASPLALMAQQSLPQNAPDHQPTPLIPAPQPTDELAEHLRTLARNPRDLDALIGAGQSALSIGDATAALSFFGRANDEAPSDGRVKAGLGSSLLLLERPDDALRLFGEAAALGIPQSKIAVDRGLAYDLRGDQASAQRDYRLALRDNQSDELVRRYALSLGISGQKSEALALLDPLLRKQDQAAWRDRTFILAMSGDVRGANSITRSVMPQQADAMEPFLRRLSSFTAAQRARAVTYGAMPEDARTNVAIPTSVIAPTRVAIAAPPPPVPHYDAPPPQPDTTPPLSLKRKHQRAAEVAAEAVTDAGAEANAPPEDTPEPVKKTKARVMPAAAQRALRTEPVSQPPAPPPAPTFVATSPPPAPVVISAPPAPKPTPSIVTAQPRFAIASLLDDVKPEAISPAAHVPTDAELRAARLAAKKKAEAKAKADAEAKALKAEEAAKREAARRNPAREWVQVAGGNNRAGFARTYAKLKAAHAALFDGRAAYYTPLNRTYRILVGPFDDASDARTYVNQLTKAGLTGFTFSSEAGQEVVKIGSKGKRNGDTAPPEEVKPAKHRRGKHSGDTADQAPTKGDAADTVKSKRKHRRR